jgi:hypothetical protein
LLLFKGTLCLTMTLLRATQHTLKNLISRLAPVQK